MTNILTVDDFSKEAVKRFIETVVFVDDKIYGQASQGAVLEPSVVSSPSKARKPSRKNIAKRTKDDGADIFESDPLSNPSFSPHDIQASFAKKQIVCSLHQPSKGLSVGLASDTFKLCACADIVVLDWDMYGDDGANTTELTKNLVEDSLRENPHQLRLVLIYTDTPNLFGVSDEIYRGLTEQSNSLDYSIDKDGLAFSTDNTRVVILGKPTNRRDDGKQNEVKEQDLADRSITEYSKLADGLLHGGILMGLAAIRKQSKKILTKFHSGLDAAFLTHRALGLPHEEGFNHLNALLVAEIEAILEDSLPKPLISDEVISDWCLEKWEPAEHSASFLTPEVEARVFAKSFCTKGMEIGGETEFPHNGSTGLAKTVKNLRTKSSWPSDPHFSSLTAFLSVSDDGTDHEKLSQIMSMREYYVERRVLTLGVIIQATDNEEEYLLCLQPICDSLRLKNETTFLFCKLDVSEENKKFTHTVDGKKLLFKPGVNQCVSISFKPSPSNVIEAKNCVFEDTAGQRYNWKAQLNSKHAQRAAEQFARQLSRVGLTESEWLRIKSS